MKYSLNTTPMMVKQSSCCKGVGYCNSCTNAMIKYGKTKLGNQRYQCKFCNKTKVGNYLYKAYESTINQNIILFTKEGLGIRSTARVLQISTTTVLKRIIAIAKNIPQPIISINKTYEVDEMRSFIKRKDKLIWIVYALERETKRVVSFTVGARTNKTLNVVLHSLQLAKAKTIYTDGLKHYPFLIEKKVHKVTRFATNHIERKNLSLRTNLKRLNRKTICYSRSSLVLKCVLRIYFWS
jgi:IS1 family transposase/transposase-like protein